MRGEVYKNGAAYAVRDPDTKNVIVNLASSVVLLDPEFIFSKGGGATIRGEIACIQPVDEPRIVDDLERALDLLSSKTLWRVRYTPNDEHFCTMGLPIERAAVVALGFDSLGHAKVIAG